MIQSCKTSKNSSKAAWLTFAVLLGLALPISAHAQFKSKRDRLIVHDILQTFSKECQERSASDGEVVARIDGEAQQAQHDNNASVQRCFEANLSLVAGVHYLYQKICDDVSRDSGRIPDTLAARQLVQVNKYQLGVRPYHSTLNDCLYAVEKNQGIPYVVPLSGLDLNAKIVQEQVDVIKINDPFPATLVPLR